MRKPSPLTLSDDARKKAVSSIRRYLTENLEEEVGDLKAALFLDYVLAELGPAIYNQAIVDARAFFEESSADLGAVSHRDEFTYWLKAKKA